MCVQTSNVKSVENGGKSKCLFVCKQVVHGQKSFEIRWEKLKMKQKEFDICLTNKQMLQFQGKKIRNTYIKLGGGNLLNINKPWRKDVTQWKV